MAATTETRDFYHLRTSRHPVASAARRWVSRMYRGSGNTPGLRPCLDPNWRRKLATETHSMFWELFLAATIRHAGYELRQKRQQSGPDLAFEMPDRGVVWIEAVAPGPGDRERNRDHVPELPTGVASEVPTEKIVLRITGALAAKYEAIRSYRASGQIGPRDPVVIAVNGHRAANWRGDSHPSLIERACFGAGPVTLEIDHRGKVANRFLAWQPTLQRSSGAVCATTFFADRDERRTEVSAVVF